MKRSVILPSLHWFDIGLLSGLFNALFVGLTTLVPINLLLIVIVLMGPLSHYSEAEVLATAPPTLHDVVQTTYTFTRLAIFELVFFCFSEFFGFHHSRYALGETAPVLALARDTASVGRLLRNCLRSTCHRCGQQIEPEPVVSLVGGC